MRSTKWVSKLSRHCANSLIVALLASALAACSSGGGTRDSGREQTELRVEPESTIEGAVAAEAEELTAQAAASSGVDQSIEPNLDEISERTQRAYDSALAAMQAQNWLQAELELEQMLLDEPGFPGPYVNLALIYKRDGRLAEARTALEQAIAIAPGFAPANNELGLMLRERGEFTAAEEAYRRALESDPANAIAHLNLGILLDLYLQRASEALDHYSQYQATRTEPDETVARWIVDLERRVEAEARVARDQ